MFISSELKKINKVENIDFYRECFLNNLISILDDYILDKKLFTMENFSFVYLDDFSLNTNCNKDSFSTLYLCIDQPLNYKTDINKNKKKNKKKIKIPQLYKSLDEFKKELLNSMSNFYDSDCIFYETKYGILTRVNLNSNDDNNKILYFNIIPCIKYVNKNNVEGMMYYSNENDIRIEYPNLVYENYNIKNNQTNDIYRQVILIFKNIILRCKNVTSVPSDIFENILYNVPNEFFIDDSYESILKITNFIRNNSFLDYKSIDEQDYVFISETRSISLIYVKHAIKQIEKFIISNKN